MCFAWWKQVWYNQILKKIFIKRDVTENNIKYFKSILNSVDWHLITQILIPDSSYNIFLDTFVEAYDIAFAERKI